MKTFRRVLKEPMKKTAKALNTVLEFCSVWNGTRNEIVSTHSRCEVISHSCLSSSCSCRALAQLSTGESTDSSSSLCCTHSSSHSELQNWQTQTGARWSTCVSVAAGQHCGCESTPNYGNYVATAQCKKNSCTHRSIASGSIHNKHYNEEK